MADKRIVGFVGKPFKDFITWLHDHGYEVHLFHDIHESYPSSEHISKVIPLDFSSKSAMIGRLSQGVLKPDFLVNTYENPVLPKAQIAAFFQLPSLSEQSAQWATDKFLMRTQFQQHCPTYSPRFAEVTTWQEIEAFLSLKEIQFPLMLKPANLYKSLLVTKNESKEELHKNFEESLSLIQTIYDKERVKFQPRFVIEEYLNGPSYSLEVFTDQHGTAVAVPSPVDLVMGRDLGEQDNYNYSRKLPSQLNAEQKKSIEACAIAGVKALQLTSSPAHVEMILTPEGPKLIEIGARTGGYRPRIHQLAQGIDLFDAQVKVAHGQLPQFTQTKNNWCAVYEIFSQQEGPFDSISNFETASTLPTLNYFSVKTKVGELTGPAKKGYRAVASAIFVSSDETQFTKDTHFFETQVKAVVK